MICHPALNHVLPTFENLKSWELDPRPLDPKVGVLNIELCHLPKPSKLTDLNPGLSTQYQVWASDSDNPYTWNRSLPFKATSTQAKPSNGYYLTMCIYCSPWYSSYQSIPFYIPIKKGWSNLLLIHLRDSVISLSKNTNLKALFIISPQNLDLENSALKG